GRELHQAHQPQRHRPVGERVDLPPDGHRRHLRAEIQRQRGNDVAAKVPVRERRAGADSRGNRSVHAWARMMTQPETLTPPSAATRGRQIVAQRSMVTLSVSPLMETSAVPQPVMVTVTDLPSSGPLVTVPVSEPDEAQLQAGVQVRLSGVSDTAYRARFSGTT